MKKKVLVLMILLGVITLGACSNASSNMILFQTDTDVVGFSAAASLDLLANAQSTTTVALQLADTDEPVVVDELDEIGKYIAMMEKFLGNANQFSFEEQTSDRAEYAFLIVYSSVDFLGEPVTYKLYYNETVIEAEVDEEDEEEEEDTEDQAFLLSEDTESEATLLGVLIIKDMEYPFEGKKEIEEGEEKIEIRSYIDEANYVRVVSKVEEEERKFKFTLVQNGAIVESSEIKVETEDNETKFQMKFSSGTSQGEYTFKMETEDGETMLKIQYKIENQGVTEEGSIKVIVEVDPETNETTYRYQVETKEGKESSTERERNRPDDDDDEDDEIEDEEDKQQNG